MEYEIDLDIFQGPLELLYNLIKKKKIKITKVSLAEITEQYLSYLEKLKDYDLNIASEFMLIASELIELKTEQLLPGNEPKKNNKKESSIIDRLRAYEKYKNTAKIMADKAVKAGNLFKRRLDVSEKYERNYRLVIDEDRNDLADIYKKILNSISIKNDESKTHKNYDLTYIREDSINVKEKIEEIYNHLEGNPSGVEFRQLVNDRNNYLEIIVTLLALLELIQKRKLKVKQDRLFSEIKIFAVGEKVLS